MNPGWHLLVRCVVCGDEEVFEGVVVTLAAERATQAGWSVDLDSLYAPIEERYALCPDHATPSDP